MRDVGSEKHKASDPGLEDVTALLYKVMFLAAQIQVLGHLQPFCGHFYYTGYLSHIDGFPNSSVLFYTISTSSLIYF